MTVYFWRNSGWVYDFGQTCDCHSFLVISTGWFVIVIVSWATENGLVYFGGKSGLVYDFNSFLGY